MQFTVSIGRAAKLLGVSVVTMRRWDKNDVITPAYRTAGNHRRYRLSDIRRLRGEAVEQKVIGYYALVMSWCFIYVLCFRWKLRLLMHQKRRPLRLN